MQESQALRDNYAMGSSFHNLPRLADEGYPSQDAHEKIQSQVHELGIRTLPNELIARIIGCVFEYPSDMVDHWPNYPVSTNYNWHKDRSQVLLVNHHFRDIAIAKPSLWTEINSSRDPQLSLERSKSSGLEITLGEEPQPPSRLKRFVEFVRPHTSRWKSFSVYTKYYGSIDNPGDIANALLKRLRDEFTGYVFPLLDELKVDYGDDIPTTVDTLDDEDIIILNDQDPNASLRSFF